MTALFNDPALSQRSGSVVIAAELARELGFTDIDGEVPEPVKM